MFDPYHEWLGLADGPRPPDHYTLLGLAPRERDPAVIAHAADMQAAKIRRIRPGQNAADWGRLLDQLTAAKNCLLDPAAKHAYDAMLPAAPGDMNVVVTRPAAQPTMALPPSMHGQASSEERPRVPFPVGYGQQPTMAPAVPSPTAPPAFPQTPPAFPQTPPSVAWSAPQPSPQQQQPTQDPAGQQFPPQQAWGQPSQPAQPAPAWPNPAMPGGGYGAPQQPDQAAWGAQQQPWQGQQAPMPGQPMPAQQPWQGQQAWPTQPQWPGQQMPGQQGWPQQPGWPAQPAWPANTDGMQGGVPNGAVAWNPPLPQSPLYPQPAAQSVPPAGDDGDFVEDFTKKNLPSDLEALTSAAWSHPMDAAPETPDFTGFSDVVGAAASEPAWPGSDAAAAAQATVVRPAQRRTSSAAPIIAALLLVIVMLGGGLAYVIKNPPGKIDVSQADGTGSPADGAGDASKEPSDDAGAKKKTEKKTDKPKKPKKEEPSPEDSAKETPTEENPAANPDQPGVADQPDPTNPDAAKPEPENPPQDNPQPDNPEPTTSEDAPPVKPEGQEDPARHEAFQKAIAEARLAMSNRDMPRAKKAVQQSLDNVQNKAEDDEAARLDAIEQNLEAFWSAMAHSISTLEPGTEFEYKDTRIIVVECSQKELVVKAGQVRRYKIEQIPTPLLTAISKDLIKPDSGWKMLLGTFLAMDANGNRTTATALWKAAAKEGEDLSQLLPELNIAPVVKKKPAAGEDDGSKAADGGGSNDVLNTQIAGLQQRAKLAKGTRENLELAKDALQQLEAAAASSKWEEAGALLEIARASARKSENAAIGKQVAIAAQQIQALKRQ